MLPHLLSRVINVPLAIEPGKLDVILEVLNQKLRGSSESAVGLVRNSSEYTRPEIRHMALFGEEEERQFHAIIPIHGTLVQRTRGLGAMSGLRSYESIRDDIEKALSDPSITGITLEIDSPGGEVAGLFDLVDYIYEARSQKPITAFINEIGFSAAYAIASAAKRIVMPRTGGVGSIGVIAVHVDQSKFDEKMGLKYTPVFAGARKNDFSRHEPLSDEALARLQAIVNDHYEIFVNAVARNRGMSPKEVKETEAGLFWGQEAVKAGLADDITSFQNYIEERTMNTGQQAKNEEVKAKQEDIRGQEVVKTESQDANSGEEQAETAEELREKIKKEVTREVRERISTIEALCGAVGHLLPAEKMEVLKKQFLEGEASIEEVRKTLLDEIVNESGKEEIISTVGALSTGEVNPVIAEAKRRAARAGKEA